MKVLRVGSAIAMFVTTLTGCGSIHLYNKSDDDLATKAKDGYDSVKLATLLQDEQTNFDGLGKKESDSFRKLLVATRDLAVLSLLVDSKQPLVTRFNQRVDGRVLEISSKSTTEARDVLRIIETSCRHALDARTAEQKRREELARGFSINTDKLPVCIPKNLAEYEKPSAEKLSSLQQAIDKKKNWEGVKDAVLGEYEKYAIACKAALQAEVSLKNELAGLPGLFGTVALDARSRAEELVALEADVKKAKSDLEDAAMEVAKTQKALAAAGKAPDLTCNEASGKKADPKDATAATAAEPKEKPGTPETALCKAIAKLKQAGDLGIKVVSEEFIKQIDLALLALSGAESDNDKAELPPGLALLSTSVRFAGALQQYQAAGTLPSLEPLLIERQLAASRATYATQAYELQKLRVALAAEKLDALLLELDLLLQSRAAMDGIIQTGSVSTCPTTEAKMVEASRADCASYTMLLDSKEFQKVPTSTREPPGRIAFRALALYAETFSSGQARYQSADLALIASEYRDSLIRSESALSSWDALISTPLAQLKTYYASGIKPEEIAQFLQAFGVIGIAARVN